MDLPSILAAAPWLEIGAIEFDDHDGDIFDAVGRSFTTLVELLRGPPVRHRRATSTRPPPVTTPPTKELPVPEPSPRPLGVALIGYAFMGRAHSQAWRTVSAAFDVPEFARRVIVGRDEEAVADAAQRLDWEEHATDWREVIARDDIDIVDICHPGFLHAEIAIAALEAGKHVLCEKPLANDTAEAEAMVDRPRRHHPGPGSGPRLHLPPRAGAGPGQAVRRRRAPGQHPPGEGRVSAGLAGGRRGTDELATTEGDGRLRSLWIGPHAIDQIQHLTGKARDRSTGQAGHGMVPPSAPATTARSR